MKKFLALILAMLLLCGALASCADVDPGPVDTVLDTEAETDDINGGVTEDPKTVYTLIVSMKFTTNEKTLLKDMAKEASAKYGVDVEFRLASKNVLNAENPNEILVGEDVRDENVAIAENVENGGYVIKRHKDSGRISVVGKTAQLSITALTYLFDTYFNGETQLLEVPEDLNYVYTVQYPIKSLSIDGVKLDKYKIIIPDTTDVYSYYTALNIADYFKANMGVEIPVEVDDFGRSDYEILIGDTNRTEDDTTLKFNAGEYMIVQKGTKIVMRGFEVYVAAAAGYIISEYLSGYALDKVVDITDLPEEEKIMEYKTPTEQAKNVILMIGDGMGFNHVNVALNATLESFAAQSFTSTGSIITKSQSVINGDAAYTDSAAAATALATGYKTINGYLGKDASGKNIKNVRELADEYGAKTAVITTDVITGATPSGFLAHNISRNNTAELQTEIDALIAKELIEYCEGSVDDAITVHTRNALNTIAYSEAPFFMMVEEARIDKRSHDNNLNSAIDKVEWYNDAIIYAACFTLVNRDTVLIVTADHETGGLTADSTAEFGYKYTTGNHTNADIPVYALGYGTDIFNNAATDNTVIAKFIAKHYGAISFGQD